MKNNSEKNSKRLIMLCAVAALITLNMFFITGCEKNAVDKNVSIKDEVTDDADSDEGGNTDSDAIDINATPVEANSKLYKDIDDMLVDYMAYYEKSYSAGNAVCVYGFMYNADTNMPVDVSEITENVPEELKQANLLYLRPGDFEVCENSEYDVNILDNDLTPFISVLTDKGYYIASSEYKGGMLTTEDYRALIMRYNCSNGEIYTPKKDSQTYNDIVNAISDNWNTDKTIDVKYIGCDDKFAVVVANLVEEPLDIREYLLQSSGNVWNIRSKELARQKNVKQYVNEMHPNMDLNILPYYNLAGYGDFRTDLYGYYDQITASNELGVNKEDLPAIYCMYSDNFIYYEFAQGKKVVGHVDNGVLTFYKVNSTDEAVALMSSFTDKPPVFIIKFG